MLRLWQDAIPSIEIWYNELRDDILNDPNLSGDAQTEALAELGSIEDFVNNLKSQHVTPIIQGIQQSTERLETRTATRLANDAISAIGEAASDVNVTEQTILQLWQAAIPSIQDWYNELREDIENDPNLSDTQQAEALAELGTVAEFVATLKSQYVDPVVQGIRSGIEALETRTATQDANNAIRAVSEAASDVNVTESTILELWAEAVPSLESWYTELHDDIINDANLSDAEQAQALDALGSVEAFVANLKSQHVTPVIQGIRQGVEALQTRTATRIANDAINAIGDAAADVDVTASTILDLWTEAVPSIEAWYSELRDDIENDPNLSDAEKSESLAALGSVEAFVNTLKSQYVTPVLQGIRHSTEALETRTASRLANNAISAISTAAADVNSTEQTILDLWNTVQPSLENWWQELYDDIINDPTLSDTEQTEALAELGSVEDFVADIQSQYVTPIIAGIRQTSEALQTQTADRLANDAIAAISEAASDINATESTILESWNTAVPLIQAWYDELRDDIENNINLSDAAGTEALAELGSFDDFLGDLRERFVAAPITQLRSRQSQTTSNLARNQVNRAQFALGNAGSEQEFEALRENLITSINAFYDTEIQRIQGLGLAAGELQDQLEDLDSGREQEVSRAVDITNTFREARIAQAEDLADELKKIEDDLAEDTADINENLADNLADIDEDLADRRERINERLNDRLSDLADDSVDAEQDRLSRIEDLNRDHQQSLEDIRLRSVRRQEDIELGLHRRIADIQRDASRDISELEDDPRLGERTNARHRQEAVAEIQREASQRIGDARLRATREREDLAVDEERRRADLATEQALEIADIQRRAAEEQAEILESRAQERQDADLAHNAALDAADDERFEARHSADLAHQELLAEVEANRVQVLHGTEMAHRENLADIEMDRQTERLDVYASVLLGLEDRIDARYTSRVSMLTDSLDRAFSAIPDSIPVDVRIPEVRAIPVAPGVSVPQAQPNPVANGDNPVGQPQSNRPTQINLVIDNTRRVGYHRGERNSERNRVD